MVEENYGSITRKNHSFSTHITVGAGKGWISALLIIFYGCSTVMYKSES